MSKSVKPKARPAVSLPYRTSKKVVHFIGIGGIGMSSLARWFLAQNWLVTGSDAVKSQITDELVKDGIKVKIGHKKTNLPQNADLVVYTAAIPLDNSEFQAAVKLGVKRQTYSEALGDLTKKYKTIAIAGSHGKSSTTAMVAAILIKARMDPTVIIGTKLNGWNFRAGKSDWLVIEADEYKGSFWHYKPYSAIVTNVDLEHVDFYKNLAAVRDSFLKFLKSVSKEGCIILNGNNENSVSLIPRLKERGNVITFSERDKAVIQKIKHVIKVPGDHNVMNALASYKLAKALGINEKIILKAISEYKGVWRRIEYKGVTAKGVKVFDDYAHHPTEIKATLQALREKFPDKKIAVCFQPHQQRRLTALYEDFITAWSDADYLLLLDVYNPKGRDETSETKNSKTLTNDVNKLSPATRLADSSPKQKAFYIGAEKSIKKAVETLPLKKSDILVLMGAGDIADMTLSLLYKSNPGSVPIS
ncbi:MAG: UDP-N-acetylmuramate--L-alanine ligase [Parcubacteria group bacterium]